MPAHVLSLLPASAPAPPTPAAGAREVQPDCAFHILLPDDLVLIIIHHLGPRALWSFGATCRRFARLGAGHVPGLALELFPHQRDSLAWMLRSERRADGPHGGILADEPGLGKTITLIAAVLRTRGMMAAAEAADGADRAWPTAAWPRRSFVLDFIKRHGRSGDPLGSVAEKFDSLAQFEAAVAHAWRDEVITPVVVVAP